MWGLLAPGGGILGRYWWKALRLVWEEPGCGVARVTLVQNCRKTGFIVSVCRKNCFEYVRVMCFRRLLPGAVAEQAFVSKPKYSC